MVSFEFLEVVGVVEDHLIFIFIVIVIERYVPILQICNYPLDFLLWQMLIVSRLNISKI